MTFWRRTKQLRVCDQGACAGSVLAGTGRNNQGLRLRVLQDQQRGQDGAVQGSLVLLDAGDNVHTASLCGLLGRVTTAAEVLDVIRREQPKCVNVLNAGGLALEDAAGRHGRLTEGGEIR